MDKWQSLQAITQDKSITYCAMLFDFIALERKVGKKRLECVRKNHVCRITNQYVMSVLMHFKL